MSAAKKTTKRATRTAKPTPKVLPSVRWLTIRVDRKDMESARGSLRAYAESHPSELLTADDIDSLSAAQTFTRMTRILELHR